MGKVGLVFPGQGTQHVGMGRELYLGYQVVKDVFTEASEILHIDLAALCFAGPRERLDLTENTQLAVLTCNLAIYRLFAETVNVTPDVMAGHSVGEYAALAAAGVIDARQVVSLVQARARYHQEAMPVGEGGMAAILGLDAVAVADLCAMAGNNEGKAFVSIINAPGQVVVSGHIPGLDRLIALAAAKTGVKAVRLPISVPCHCDLLKDAAEAFKADLKSIVFRDGSCPVIPNCAPELFYTGENAAELLLRQITRPVRWQETIERMASLGVDTIVELGPKRTLVNLIKRIDPNIRLFFVGDRPSLDKALAYFNG